MELTPPPMHMHSPSSPQHGHHKWMDPSEQHPAMMAYLLMTFPSKFCNVSVCISQCDHEIQTCRIHFDVNGFEMIKICEIIHSTLYSGFYAFGSTMYIL